MRASIPAALHFSSNISLHWLNLRYKSLTPSWSRSISASIRFERRYSGVNLANAQEINLLKKFGRDVRVKNFLYKGIAYSYLSRSSFFMLGMAECFANPM